MTKRPPLWFTPALCLGFVFEPQIAHAGWWECFPDNFLQWVGLRADPQATQHALERNTAIQYGRDEVGLQNYVLGWDTIRAFDAKVWARFHTLQGEADRPSTRHVPGGSSGQGRESYTIINRGNGRDGEVIGEYRFKLNEVPVILRVKAISTHQRSQVPRGYHWRATPDIQEYRSVENSIEFRFRLPDRTLFDPRQIEWLQERVDYAMDLARSHVEIYKSGDSFERYFEARVEESGSQTSPRTLGGKYLSSRQLRGVDFFLAGMFDSLKMTDSQFQRARDGLRRFRVPALEVGEDSAPYVPE